LQEQHCKTTLPLDGVSAVFAVCVGLGKRVSKGMQLVDLAVRDFGFSKDLLKLPSFS